MFNKKSVVDHEAAKLAEKESEKAQARQEFVAKLEAEIKAARMNGTRFVYVNRPGVVDRVDPEDEFTPLLIEVANRTLVQAITFVPSVVNGLRMIDCTSTKGAYILQVL